jgi:hypothetical protein
MNHTSITADDKRANRAPPFVSVAYPNGSEINKVGTSANQMAPSHPTRRMTAAVGVAALCFVTAAAPGPRETPLNPTDHDYLYRQHVWFQSQDPETQQRYRRLHAAYEALPTDEQAHLARVLQSYQTWLARLPESDRELVYAAPTGAERLAVVRRLREAEWVATLPAPYRKDYEALSDESVRRAKAAAWRAELADRREEWAVAQRNWPDFQPGRLPAALQAEMPAVNRFLDNLRHALNEEERRQLDQAEDASHNQYLHYPFFWMVANLAEAHPLCPGRVGPKDFASLPPAVVKYLLSHGKVFKKRGDSVAPVAEVSKELRRSVGRWPDFAIELTRYCQRHGLTDLPPLGDCRESDMPPEVKDALKRLRDQVKRSKEVKDQLDQLQATEGKWPDYPLKVVEVCRKNQVPVVGWTLPGPQAPWDKLKAGRGKGK